MFNHTRAIKVVYIRRLLSYKYTVHSMKPFPIQVRYPVRVLLNILPSVLEGYRVIPRWGGRQTDSGRCYVGYSLIGMVEEYAGGGGSIPQAQGRGNPLLVPTPPPPLTHEHPPTLTIPCQIYPGIVYSHR